MTYSQKYMVQIWKSAVDESLCFVSAFILLFPTKRRWNMILDDVDITVIE